jgi:hypothetical protein
MQTLELIIGSASSKRSDNINTVKQCFTKHFSDELRRRFDMLSSMMTEKLCRNSTVKVELQ